MSFIEKFNCSIISFLIVVVGIYIHFSKTSLGSPRQEPTTYTSWQLTVSFRDVTVEQNDLPQLQLSRLNMLLSHIPDLLRQGLDHGTWQAKPVIANKNGSVKASHFCTNSFFCSMRHRERGFRWPIIFQLERWRIERDILYSYGHESPEAIAEKLSWM